MTVLLQQIIFSKYFSRIPDWRQTSGPTDYVIVAPKVRHLRKNILGYTCPSEFYALETDEEDFKILSDGKLMVNLEIYISLRV